MELPEAFATRMRQMLGEEYPNFVQALLYNPPYSGIRWNETKENADAALLRVFGPLEPVPWCARGYYVQKEKISGNHPFHLAGLFYFQEPSAMAPVEGLPIAPGDRVLDLCAAPGGKSTHAAGKLQGKGLLVSNEIISKRAAILSENIQRMGIPNAVVTSETPPRLAEKFPAFFDKIIVDAPCSGEGMFRKEEQAAIQWSPEHTRSCALRQKNILESAMNMLAPGGYLVYSTCTFAPEENEKVAAWLLDSYPNLELAPMEALSMLEPGRSDWGKTDWDLSLTRRSFPHRQKGEGHFTALFHDTRPQAARVQPPPGKVRKNPALDQGVSLWRDFEKQALTIRLEGCFRLFGENLYLLPEELDLDQIKVLRCGLHLGVCKKGRFEPSHALCLALEKNSFRQVLSLPAEDPALKEYLMGNVLSGSTSGWTAVCAGEYPLGWGKASGGTVKNHYPKFLRLKR